MVGIIETMRDPLLQDRAREMRKHMPESELRPWQWLRRKQIEGFKFRRQYQIGRYIADFASIEARLVVEIDGDHHGNDNAEMRDAHRGPSGLKLTGGASFGFGAHSSSMTWTAWLMRSGRFATTPP